MSGGPAPGTAPTAGTAQLVRTLTAAAYLRRSTPGQHASLPSQEAAARAHAGKQGYRLPDDLIFRDTASGTRSDREGFWDLLKAIDAGRVQVLLAWDLFRAGSNDLDAALLAMKCKEQRVKIEVVSTGGSYILENPDSKLQYRIMMALSDWRRENFLLTSGRGKDFLAPKGHWVHGAAPPGYSIEGGRGRKRLVPNEHAPAILDAFRLYADGASTIKVAAWLRDHDIPARPWSAPKDHPTQKGALRRWNSQAVCRLLERRVYIGEIPHSGNWYPGLHQPIVDRDLWDRVQARRERQRERCPGRPKKSAADGPGT